MLSMHRIHNLTKLDFTYVTDYKCGSTDVYRNLVWPYKCD